MREDFVVGPYSPLQSLMFTNEIHFYTDILEALKRFEETANIPQNERIDAFARYFGSRLSNIRDTADADAIILLENLKSLNFSVPNVWNQLEIDEAMVLLKVHLQVKLRTSTEITNVRS